MNSELQNKTATGNEARTEQALRASELSYRRLFEAAQDGILILDVDTGRVTDVNPFLVKLLGFSHGEMVGKTVRELRPFKDIVSNQAMLERLQADGYVRYHDLPLETRDGRKIAVEFVSNVYQAGDRKVIQCNVRDITERKRAAEEIQAILRTMMDGFYLVDTDGRFLDTNDSYCRMIGYSREELLKMAIKDVEAIEPDEVIKKRIQQIKKTGHAFFETKHRRKDGRIIDIEASCSFLGGEKSALYVFMRDITERKLAEEALRKSEERYHGLFEHMVEGFAYCRMIFENGEPKDWVYLSVNSAFEKLTGLKGVAGKRVSEVIPGIAETDPELFKCYARVSLTGEPERIEIFVKALQQWFDISVYSPGKEFFVAVFDVITERKRAEEALRNSEARFRTLIERSPVAISISRSGKTIYVNRKYLDLYGFQSVDELAGKMVTDQWAPEFRETVMERAQKRARGEPVPSDYEGIGLRKDGFRFPVHISVSLVELPDGTASMAFLNDITERKQAEEALRNSEAFLNTVIEKIPHMIFVKDAKELRFVKFNKAGEELLGYSLAELAGKNDHDLFPKEMADYFTENDRKVLRGREVVDIPEEPVQTRDKGERILHTKKIPVLDNAGQLTYLLGISEDITEHKRAEESHAKLATAVEQAAETILITDTHGTILYANPAFEKSTGYTCAEALGQNPRFLKSGKQDAEFYRRMWEVLGRGEIWSGHFINRRKDGAVYEEEATISPVRDAAGTIINYVAVKRDVTREKQLEAQFNQLQKMEAVGQLAGGVAHDFNNILGVIMGYGDLITADLDPDSPLRKYAEEIRNAAERAAGLTRQLLVFSRKQKVQPVVLDLNGTVKDLDKMLRRLIGENIEMMVAPGNEVGRIKADPGYVGQVLMNLAVNARDAIPNGGKLTIATNNVTLDENYTRTHTGVIPGDYVMMSVSDTGTGMTEEVKARMFEPLFTTKPEGKGTGLGLATCQTIVQQSGGHIGVYSEVGKGTTFKIYFPRVDKPLDDAGGSSQNGPLPRGTETLLVVEDEPSVRHLAWKVLETLGYHVLRANNGQDGLHLAREHKGSPIRLVVTDVMMPKMGGKVMAEWLKATYPDLKVLFTSGYTDDVIAQHGVLEPGVAFLSKPYTPAALARKVRTMLDNETDTSILRKRRVASDQNPSDSA